MMHRTGRWATLLIAGLLAATTGEALAAEPSSYVWIEAEKHDACNFAHFEASSMGKPKLLSGGEWIMKGMGQEEITKLVPDDGIRLKYDLNVAQRGKYNLWARVGFYGARADFEWRVGGGDWSQDHAHDQPDGAGLLLRGVVGPPRWDRPGRRTNHARAPLPESDRRERANAGGVGLPRLRPRQVRARGTLQARRNL